MKIAILMGSPRKKDSYHICELIEKSFAHEIKPEFEYVHLSKLHIEDCRGCDQCFQKGEEYCPCKDDLESVKEKLRSADGIIFVSPVYAEQVTGTMKRTLDRLSYLFHRQEFVGKPALIVVTTGGGGQKATRKYLRMTACGWGCHLIGEISIVAPMFFENNNQQSVYGHQEKYYLSNMQKIKKLSRSFEDAVLSEKPHVPTYYDIFLFQCLRSKTFISKVDYEYWDKKGWLESNYYYQTKLNPCKVVFSRMIRKYIDSAAKRILGSA